METIAAENCARSGLDRLLQTRQMKSDPGVQFSVGESTWSKKTQAGILVVAVRRQNTQGTAGSCDKYNRGLVLFRHTDGGDVTVSGKKRQRIVGAFLLY